VLGNGGANLVENGIVTCEIIGVRVKLSHKIIGNNWGQSKIIVIIGVRVKLCLLNFTLSPII